MFNDFSLLQGTESLYQKVVSLSGDGTVIGGVYYPPEETVSYTKFTGDWEPYKSQGMNKILPSGVSEKDAIIIYTDKTSLKIHDDLHGQSSLADSVYLQDPTTNPYTKEFVVFHKMTWISDVGMQLLKTNYAEYICIAREKL